MTFQTKYQPYLTFVYRITCKVICSKYSSILNFSAVILSAPRSWRQVCAIRNLRKVFYLLPKVRIAQTCVHDLGTDKMTLQILLRSWQMMSMFSFLKVNTDFFLLEFVNGAYELELSLSFTKWTWTELCSQKRWTYYVLKSAKLVLQKLFHELFEKILQKH